MKIAFSPRRKSNFWVPKSTKINKKSSPKVNNFQINLKSDSMVFLVSFLHRFFYHFCIKIHAKIDQKSIKKSIQNLMFFLNGFLIHFGMDFGAKMEEKSMQKRCQKHLGIGLEVELAKTWKMLPLLCFLMVFEVKLGPKSIKNLWKIGPESDYFLEQVFR